MNYEDLSKEGITDVDVLQIWARRRERMALRREYFESLWRSGIQSFFQGIVGESINGSRPLYNTLYEQYDFSLFSRDGIRFNNIKYPLVHAIIMRALANEVPNKPLVNFIAVGTNNQSKPIAFRHLFNQVLYEMGSDAEDFEVFLDKRIFGSSAVVVFTDEYDVTVKDPVYNKETGETSYEKKTKKVRQCGYRKLDLRHLYLDEHCTKTDLSDCGYAIVDEFYSKEEFKQKFSKYPADKLEQACASVMEKDEGTVFYNWYDVKDAEFVRVSYCWDKVYDCLHIIAGSGGGQGVLLNKVDNPIPRIAGRKGKDIPIAIAIQYKIPGAPFGYGDAHVTRSFNQIKNLVRVMLLEITQKAAKPMLAIDPLSNFDEQGFQWGQDFIRVAPKDLQEIKTNPDLKSLYDMDKMTDDDVIRATGININDTISAQGDETARKTIIRRESQNALIELMMGYMSDSFFCRLYTLLKDEVRLHYGTSLKKGDKIKVRTENVHVTRTTNGKLSEESVTGFRYFDVKPGDLDFDMELDLQLGNMASSRELEKALIKEALQTASMVPNGFSQDGLAKYIVEGYNMPDDTLAKPDLGISSQDPKEIAKQGLPPELLPDDANLDTNVTQNGQLEGQGNVPALQESVAAQ